MARVPRLQDVSVPLSTRIPAYPGNPAFELQPIRRVAEGGSGVTEMSCLPLRLVGADGAPARVVLRR